MSNIIKPFEVRGYFGNYRDARQMPPEVAFRELVKNAIEAGARTIEIRLTQQGFAVLDDGCGMTAAELTRNFSRFHESGKRLGDQANFGIGAKMAFLALGGVSMTVTSRKANKEPFCIELGRSRAPDHDETDGWIHGPVQDENGNLIRPGTLNPRWKTEVSIRCSGFEPERVLKALNGRFESIDINISVHYSTSTGRTSQVVRGFMSSMERASRSIHRHELASCILIWGQKGSGEDQNRILDEEWDGPTLSFSHQGEVYSSKTGERAAKWLDGAGISIGASQLFVLIIPRGQNLRWNNNRTQVVGVEMEEIQTEIAQAIEAGTLSELNSFLEWFEAANTSARETMQTRIQNGLARLADVFGISPPRGEGTPKTPDDRGESDTDERRRRESNSTPGATRSRSPRKPRGYPEPQTATAEVTGGNAVVYSAHRHVLYVWTDHPHFKPYLDLARTRPVKEQLQLLLLFEIVAGYSTLRNNIGEVGQDELDVIAQSCFVFKCAARNGVKARPIDLFGV